MSTGVNLLRFFDAVYIAALGIWAGVVLFCGLGVHSALGNFEGPVRAEVDRRLLLRGLVWGAVCGAVALPSLVCGAMAVPELRGPIVGVKSALLLTALLLTIGRAAAVGRNRQPVGSRTVESFVAVILLGLLGAQAYRDPPATRGIEEPSPLALYQAHEKAAHRQSTRFRSKYQAQPPPQPPQSNAQP